MTAPLILSVGADGRFAGMVVPELARRGARVRGLVHRAENADKARAAGAQEVAVRTGGTTQKWEAIRLKPRQQQTSEGIHLL